MASQKLSALVDLAGGQVPTDLMYIVDVSAGAAGSKKSTLNDAFSIITKNITDLAVRFQGAAAPAVSAAGAGSIYFDSTANAFRVSENTGAYRAIGDVTGPAGATDEALARFDGATGKLLQNSAVTLSNAGAFTFPDDIRQTFNPGANAAGLNVGAVGADPGTPVNGDLWYDSGNNLLRARINGATVSLGASTPPGGANTQVQFNNAGAFGGITGFTSDGTNVTAGDGNLRATSPLITTSIDDANSNSIIGLSPAGSAVNQITIANAATGNSPVISTTGSDANINLTFTPKGTGVNIFTKNLLMNVGAGSLDNLIYTGSLSPGSVNASFGFLVGGVGSGQATEGPYFLGRGNSFTASANQRGSMFFAAGAGFATPTTNEGSINFFAGALEDLRLRISRPGSGLPCVLIDQVNTGEIGLAVNNVSASTVAIATFSVNNVPFVTINSDANSYFGNGIVNAAPASYALNATGGSGTDIAGASLSLAGGKGTGNALAGFVGIRFPLVGGSGTTLQSLSTNSFRIPVIMLTQTANATVANTTSETTLIGTISANSTKTFEAGMARVDRLIKIAMTGSYVAESTDTLTIRIKMGSTTIFTIGPIDMPNIAAGNGFWSFQATIRISAIGAGGTTGTDGVFMYAAARSDSTNIAAADLTHNGVPGSVDFTASQVIDVTAQWSAASPNNSIISTTAEYFILPA